MTDAPDQITFPLADEAATHALAARLAAHLRAGDVLLLDGPLAAGKTSFVRALVAARGSADPVSSPTYTIAQHYDSPAGPILHVDAYRLGGAGAFHQLGLEEYDEALALIEWGSLIAEAFERPLRLEIALAPGAPEARRATLRGEGPRWAALAAALGVGA